MSFAITKVSSRFCSSISSVSSFLKTYQKSLKLKPSTHLDFPQASQFHSKLFNAALKISNVSCYFTTCQNSLSSPLIFDSHKTFDPIENSSFARADITKFGPSLSSAKKQLITCISNTQETLNSRYWNIKWPRSPLHPHNHLISEFKSKTKNSRKIICANKFQNLLY